MARFVCEDFRPVEAFDGRAAAEIFGGRLARREFGRRGECVTVRLDTSSERGRAGHYQVSVGYPEGQGRYRVWDRWLTVRVAAHA